MPLYFLSNFAKNADSLGYGRILKKSENNPEIRITVLHYTVIEDEEAVCSTGTGPYLI